MPATEPNDSPWQWLRPTERRKLFAAGLGLCLAVFLLVFSNVAANHSPKPHGLPTGVVGTPAVVGAVSDQLARNAPGAFAVHGYSSLAAAKTAIQHRSVYGAYQPGPPPVILIANAASPPVATLLQKTFTPAAAKLGAGQPSIQDVAPLPPWDSSGATSFSGVLALIIAGLGGASLVYNVTRNRNVVSRLIAVFVLAIGGGLAFVLVTNIVVGAFRGPPSQFFILWGVATLFILAISLPITAFQVVFGVAGVAVGWLLFLVIGNPASGGSSAPQLLPTVWRWVSQGLPPGAASTSVRDVVYFNAHGSGTTMLVLAGYAIGGAALAVALYARRAHRTTARSTA